jgi:hypothetical protein
MTTTGHCPVAFLVAATANPTLCRLQVLLRCPCCGCAVTQRILRLRFHSKGPQVTTAPAGAAVVVLRSGLPYGVFEPPLRKVGPEPASFTDIQVRGTEPVLPRMRPLSGRPCPSAGPLSNTPGHRFSGVAR